MKSKMLTALLPLLIIFCFVKNSMAQQDVPDKIYKNFELLKSFAPIEKIYTITDRDNYVSGDIMWFTLFNLSHSADTLLSFSKVGYVELLDLKNEAMLQTKIELQDGRGKGSFTLPENLKTGYYVLRCYTNWMRNFSPEFYFEKKISVNNIFNNEVIASLIKAEPVVNFYAEGGRLIANSNGKIAIAITDSFNAPLKFSGSITGPQNDTLTSFTSAENGCTAINFKPLPAKYSAVFTLEDGRKLTRPLPDIIEIGTALRITDTAGNKIIVTTTPGSKQEELFLIIHDRKNIEFAQKILPANGISNIIINKKELSGGLKNIVVFDGEGIALNERLFFVQQDNTYLTASTERPTYGKRQKVILDVKTNDTNSIDQPVNVSVSVYRIDSPLSFLSKTHEADEIINSNIFRKEDVGITNTMLLTHSWKWFNWNDLTYLKPAQPKYLPEFEGHIISAKLIDQKTKVPLANVVGYLSVPGKAFQFYTSKSNRDGTINFFTKKLYGDNLIIAQGESATGGATVINIITPFSGEYTSTKKNISFHTKKPASQQIQQGINVQLQKNFVRNKMIAAKPHNNDSIPFFGKETIKYDLDDYVRFPTMEEVLREYVRELNVKKRKDEFALSMVTKNENSVAIIKNPAIFIDGVPAFDTGNKITHYDPLKIKTIKIITDKYYYGPATFDGIASFTTYKGDLDGYSPDANATIIDYSGLQIPQKFYSPVYETPAQRSSRIPDFRDLLYWNDDVKIMEDGKGLAEFYTSDQIGAYNVVITTLRRNGMAHKTTVSFNVIK